jgi:hypothetical protein
MTAADCSDIAITTLDIRVDEKNERASFYGSGSSFARLAMSRSAVLSARPHGWRRRHPDPVRPRGHSFLKGSLRWRRKRKIADWTFPWPSEL